MPDANAAADRNLLFGMLALQLDFINRNALVAAMQAWVFAKHKPLGQILQEQGALREDLRPLLDGLVEKYLQQHSGDPEKSLAALSSVASSVREQLGQINDPDVQASQMHFSTASRPAADLYATRSGAAPLAAPAGTRFRILRPHAKGGLGQVSVALDQELGREVALKEIQDQHADHPESRSRFLLEAEITGGLEHPGIVPVYGLGHYGDGRPFYAMRFIRGDSLKEAVARFHQADGKPRDPGERALALRQLLGRFVDVCNALAYAHARGVLHRDLKPGNIMLGEYGETLVVDWGLAKPLGQPASDREKELGALMPPSASGTTLTQMGSAVGTPQYMSPEQAEGRLDELGPQSDVYSLGATLYTVLTGKPPVEGHDMGAILRKVQRGEVVPPRQVKREVPPALEAICQKAMALKPADRYPTARSLAEDIEHWLADEPVSAYRDPWLARAARWARRHRPLVAGLSGLVLTALAALLVTTVLVTREQARTEVQRRQAEANFAVALAAVNDMLTEVAQEQLVNEPRMEKKRHALLLRARDYYQQFLDQRGGDPRLVRETAQAYRRVGDIARLVGDYDQARSAYGQAIALFLPLANANPDDLDARRALGDCYGYRGEVQRLTSHNDEARADYRLALDREQPLADAHPERPEFRMDLARTWYNLGILAKDTRQYGEAEASLNHAVGLLKELVVQHKDQPLYRQHLARAYLNLGPVLRVTDRPDQARAAYLKAAGLQEGLLEIDPTSPDYRYELGVTLNNLGLLQYTQNDLPGAEESYRRAVALYDRLAVQFPDVPVFRKELANVRDNLGAVLAYTEREPAAEEVWQQARAGLHQLAAEHPDVPEYAGLEMEGGVRAMLMTRIKTAVGLVLALGLLGIGAGTVTSRALTAQQPQGEAAAPAGGAPAAPQAAAGQPPAAAKPAQPGHGGELARAEAESRLNLKQIALAIINYCDAMGRLPEPAIYAGEKNPGAGDLPASGPGRMSAPGRGHPLIGGMGGFPGGGGMAGGTPTMPGGQPGMGGMPGMPGMGGSGVSMMPPGMSGGMGGAGAGAGGKGKAPAQQRLALAGGKGKALLSWRVIILPYLGEQELYRQFKLDEPWDGPHNKKLLARMPKVYAPPGTTTAPPNTTFYQVFVGPHALFEKHQTLFFPASVTDGTSNTLLVVEGGSPVPWTKPEDLHFAPDEPLPELGGLFPGICNAAFCDGSVCALRKDADPDILRAAITRDGGEVVDLDRLLRPANRLESELRQQNARLKEELRREGERLDELLREKQLLDEETAGTRQLREENARLEEQLRKMRAQAEQLAEEIRRAKQR